MVTRAFSPPRDANSSPFYLDSLSRFVVTLSLSHFVMNLSNCVNLFHKFQLRSLHHFYQFVQLFSQIMLGGTLQRRKKATRLRMVGNGWYRYPFFDRDKVGQNAAHFIMEEPSPIIIIRRFARRNVIVQYLYVLGKFGVVSCSFCYIVSKKRRYTPIMQQQRITGFRCCFSVGSRLMILWWDYSLPSHLPCPV